MIYPCMWKKAGNPKVEELTKSIKDRSYNLSCLRPVKLEELNAKGKPKRLCAWCAEGELFHGNAKYCTTVCSESAEAWAYPQKEYGLKYLLLRQDFKCAGCQFDYKPFMDAVRAKDVKDYGTCWEYANLPWHYFKRLKSRVSKENKPEVDHIVAITNGGDSLGISNHQVLCYTCHKVKTKVDLSRPRKK